MSSERPNVICITADDLGWRDLGCYGSPFYETPNLDQLAREGTRFTDAYAASPVCSPTRASVMTGNYPARVGVTDWIDFWGETHPARGKLVDAEYSDHLPHEQTTLAAALGDAGYDTCHVGKWHLGGVDQESSPEDHGFDVNVGGCEWGKPSGEGGYFRPWEIPTIDESNAEADAYLPDRLADEAVTLIEESTDDDAPLFLNYNPYLVHTPLQAPDRLVERYERKRAALGLDDIAEFELGGRFPAEHKQDRRIKRRLVQSDPVYAAMVEVLDRSVGRVLDALERTGQAANTLVVFTSDNGGLATAEGSPTTNRPLSEGKGWMQEGGNRVPLIVRWPGVTDTEDTPAVVETPVISPDIYPTALDAAGVETPDGQAIDGESLRSLFAGADLDREAVFWHYPHYGNQGGTPAAAVRAGDWKLIEFFETDHVELYHLADDVREEQDLSDHRPDTVADLQTRLREWQDEVGARFPAEDPSFESWPDRAGPYGSE